LIMEELIAKAIDAREKAYTPYSHFKVGVCLKAKNGETFQGCNIENSSYPATNCAERTAIFKAVSEGITDFSCIVIVGGRENEKPDFCPPCGICRQVMAEFCDPETFQIILAKSEKEYKMYLLKELLPLSFVGDLL
jgi:cytidine deaminase